MKDEHISASINRHCLCKTLDMEALIRQMNKEIDYKSLIETRPNIFSHTAVYLSPSDFENINRIIQTIESVIAFKSFQEQVLQASPPISHVKSESHGVFMGYDFHLTSEGPKLIEINTNAGGAYLNLILARAQIACCEGVHLPFDVNNLEDTFFEMFLNEWRLGGNELPLKNIAIIDENPIHQFLYPEFQLFSSLFNKHGVGCFILDPSELVYREGVLFYEDKKIDLIYNRLTDFYFDEEKHAHLKDAFKAETTVFTPNPVHHALFANKNNLELLTHQESLLKLGLAQDRIDILLNGIPHTTILTNENCNFFWDNRKKYFFKPASGFGSKATYRGDKTTKRVWEEIKKANYVAQEIAPPGLRVLLHEEAQAELKMDLRAYTYNGKIQLMACRLYSGQTTNFRTPGGGFAPVFLI